MNPAIVLLCVAATLTAIPHAAADERAGDHPLAAGADFCFSRDYDRAHLAAHPAQSVTSVRLMGRNAWQAAPGKGSVYASLLMTFRHGQPLLMNGRCFNVEGSDSRKLRCKFFLDSMQDMLAQTAILSWPSDQTLRMDVTSDWQPIRRRQEPTNPPRPAAQEDARFHLTRTTPGSCSYPRGFWTRQGPTEKLLGWLP